LLFCSAPSRRFLLRLCTRGDEFALLSSGFRLGFALGLLARRLLACLALRGLPRGFGIGGPARCSRVSASSKSSATADQS